MHGCHLGGGAQGYRHRVNAMGAGEWGGGVHGGHLEGGQKGSGHARWTPRGGGGPQGHRHSKTHGGEGMRSWRPPTSARVGPPGRPSFLPARAPRTHRTCGGSSWRAACHSCSQGSGGEGGEALGLGFWCHTHYLCIYFNLNKPIFLHGCFDK